MGKFCSFIEKISEWAGKQTAWLTTALVLLICWDVSQRYVFKTSTAAMLEMEWYLFSIIFLMGAGYTLKHDKHVRVDVFYAKMSPRQQAWIDFTGTILFLIPFCLVVIYGACKYTLVSFNYNEASPDAGGLPARYLIKAVIPIGFLFLLLQSFAFGLRAYLAIKKAA